MGVSLGSFSRHLLHCSSPLLSSTHAWVCARATSSRVKAMSLPLQNLAAPHALLGAGAVSVVLALCPYRAGEAYELTLIKRLTLVRKPGVLYFLVVGPSGLDSPVGGFATTGGVLFPGLVAVDELGEEGAGGRVV